jgi:xanthine dehydrogenase accessory factor
VGVRAEAADAGVRRDRLRGRGRPGGELSGLSDNGLRRAPGFRHEQPVPEADEVVIDWPHRYLAAEAEAGRIDARTVITVLTHDPKFDVPLLEVALRLPVGAMGSRRTHEDRLERLREAGVDEKEIARLSSPIGLDLGARTPEETAISIAAEIVAARWGGTGERLALLEGPIHEVTRRDGDPA